MDRKEKEPCVGTALRGKFQKYKQLIRLYWWLCGPCEKITLICIAIATVCTVINLVTLLSR